MTFGMPTPTTLLIVTIAILAAAAAATLSAQRRARARGRLWQEEPASGRRPEPGRLSRWLALAGYRRATAAYVFVGACIGCLGAGLVLALALGSSPLLLRAAYDVAALPVVGSTFARGVMAMPWLGAFFMAAMPVLVVRARRERRMAAIEQDLPMLLELLATLAESGLGFDASLDRVIESQPTDRPLLEELRIYELEVRAGGGRAECLERLAQRIEVPSVTSSIAALVQAEEIGSGLADVLRPLADDLRLRRRERALAQAEALPEKLVFPLVIGFLPGLMVWTLGPSFYQLLNTVDAIMRQGP